MFNRICCICLYPSGGSTFGCMPKGCETLLQVGCMPKGRETLLQVKQRQTRELRLRTQARCAELLGETHQGSSGHQTRPEPVSICLCCVCHKVNQLHNLRARPQSSTPQQNITEDPYAANHIIADDEGALWQEDSHIHPRLKEGSLCINVSCFLLILVAINSLFLQYIWLHKADSY